MPTSKPINLEALFVLVFTLLCAALSPILEYWLSGSIMATVAVVLGIWCAVVLRKSVFHLPASSTKSGSFLTANLRQKALYCVFATGLFMASCAVFFITYLVTHPVFGVPFFVLWGMGLCITYSQQVNHMLWQWALKGSQPHPSKT
ncbi:hypothetical protein ACFQ45_06660 [Rhodanobacter aciditrophus]|uniref:Uncharacterized protein n=1 Tax=Rhodanobacter aciditrophus TaxID=1623218 RepID=A0ABW4AZN8_9GAMM